jgi:glycosyltransferase involved in cell wall biosynthesis
MPQAKAKGPRDVTLVAYDVAPVGGMERAAYELAVGLLARGHRVCVIACTCAVPAQPGLTFVRIPGPSRPKSLQMTLFALLGSLALLRHRGRDSLVHTVGAVVLPRADVITVQFCFRAFARTGLRRARRTTLAYRINDRATTALGTALERWGYRPSRGARLVPVSGGVARELSDEHGTPSEAVTTIPNGVDHGIFRADPRERRRIRAELGLNGQPLAAFVGGDWGRKGLRPTIEALGLAPDWTLVVVGDGGDLAAHEAIARDAGAGDRVRFVGRKPNPAAYFAASDAFILPTAYEAHPLVALEAAATSLPLLATRVNGLEDLIVDGESGWFIDRTAESIAGRLRELAADGPRRRAMGGAALASVENLSWERIVDDYGVVYRELDGAGATS